MGESQARQRELECPLCDCTDFEIEEGGLDSKWGMTQFTMEIAICQRCSYVMLFSKGRSFWMNFD